MRTAKFPEGKPASHLLQHHVNRTCFISWTLYFSRSCTHPWPPLTSLLFVEIGQTFTVLSSCMLFSKKPVITIKAHTAKFLSTLPSTNTTGPSLWPTISHRTFLNSLSHIETPKYRQKGQAALKNKMHLWLKDPLQGHYYLSSLPPPRASQWVTISTRCYGGLQVSNCSLFYASRWAAFLSPEAVNDKPSYFSGPKRLPTAPPLIIKAPEGHTMPSMC